MRSQESSTPEETAMPGKSSNGLTELQAKIVELRDEHGLGFREIGEQLGGKNQGNIHRFYTAAK